jgi:hypothetical protein
VNVKYQKQSHDEGCMHACIAMYKGIPQEEVQEQFPPGEGTNVTARKMLVHYGIPYLDVHPILWMNIPGFHLLHISLGNEQRHAVLARVNDDGTFDVWDPVLGEQLKTKSPFLGDIVEVNVLLEDEAEVYGPGSVNK